MANDCDAVLIVSTLAMGLPYRGSPVVRAVGEVANMKQRKLLKTEDGVCRSSSAIQTQVGPLTLLEEWSGTLFCCFLCVVGYPSN